MIYRHPTRPGSIVVAHGGKMGREVPVGTANVIERASDGSYSAFVPDLPGCTTSGETVEEVKSQIKDAVDS